MSVILSKPIQVQVQVGNPIQQELDEDFVPHTLEHCKWADIFKALETFYSDMEVKVHTDDDKITITFRGKNRPTDKYEISLRLDDFLSSAPQMPIKSVKII